MLSLIQTALELGLISSLTVLALYLSYSMLNICDLSTDGAFTLGACTGAVLALSGHPYLSIPAAMAAGVLSGILTALLQTVMGIDSLLSGIVVNTGLYSVNIAIMDDSSLLNLNRTDTLFTKIKTLLEGTAFSAQYRLLTAALAVTAAGLFLSVLLNTKLGLAIRATGDNITMVRMSSINTTFIQITGLAVSNSLTALSGCLMAQYNKSVNIDIGTGMLTMALASLLIGRMFFSSRGVSFGVVGSVIGAILFRLVYTLALRFHMPAYMLKLISSVIVIVAISGPYFYNLQREKMKRAANRKAGQ